jgi:hypothetical protein
MAEHTIEEKKIIGPYIWVNIILKKIIGLRPKLGNTYYHTIDIF